MKKLDKILMLLNLFYTRKRVTMDTILRVCDIPERTAYRYLNTLSEANIPIYFDKDSRAYRLNTDDSVEVDNLNMNEQVLLVLALRILSGSLGSSYKTNVDRLSRKLFTRMSLPMEEVWYALGKTMKDEDLSIDNVNRLATTALVLAAMQANRPIQLRKNTDPDGVDPAILEQPSIIFGAVWSLIDRNLNGNQTPTALDDITEVSIE
ncbi:hypothetical protein KQH82_02720 [bacterium]|nr:hypothetical protein [bacterium]